MPEKKTGFEGFPASQLRRMIVLNIKALRDTLGEVEVAVGDDDVEFCEVESGNLISQSTGLRQMFEVCRKHRFRISKRP